MTFSQFPLDQIRFVLPKCKRQIQLGMKRLVVTRNGEIIGYLVPIKDMDDLDESEICFVSISEFNRKSEIFFDDLPNLDYLIITINGFNAIALVNPKHQNLLPIPVSDVAHKLLESAL